MNMKHCRFKNTSEDLADCVEALRNGEGRDRNLNPHEKNGKARLIALCREVVEMADHGGEGTYDHGDPDTHPAGDDATFKRENPEAYAHAVATARMK